MIQGLPDKAVINDLKAFNEQCLNVSSASGGRRILQSEDSAPEVTQCDDGKPHDHRWTLGLRRPNIDHLNRARSSLLFWMGFLLIV